jgi:Sortase domain
VTWTAPVATRQRFSPWWLVAAALLLVGAGSLTLGLRNSERGLPGPVASHAAAHVGKAPPTQAPAAARSVPVTLRIPAMGLSTPLSTLGLNPDGTVEVPTSYQQAGWFGLGPTPGQRGSAVMLGHVDSHSGPGVFFQLRTLTDGDKVAVDLADGATATFVVIGVATYAKEQFPAKQVYGSHGYSALQLVTCGGVFDSQTGGYLSNVVVYTALESLTPQTQTPSVAGRPVAKL